ncbi:uncharacterized protein TrAtP1_006103 [Trichoderma atroviride]|uniref:uncharacterized protein n=1 Tax=Hypocrea atroviridis TaxID=63577 RepID=UPI00333315CD|nr:hypothetical protein TrAtP1_006103 [Trichoderma atroviride]
MVLGLASGKATAMDRYHSPASSSSPASTSASASTPAAGVPIIYGRVDAANEDNLELIHGIDEHGASERRAKVLRPSPSAQPGAQPQPHRDAAIMQDPEPGAQIRSRRQAGTRSKNSTAPLLAIPPGAHRYHPVASCRMRPRRRLSHMPLLARTCAV